jgi:hypothetical protein
VPSGMMRSGSYRTQPTQRGARRQRLRRGHTGRRAPRRAVSAIATAHPRVQPRPRALCVSLLRVAHTTQMVRQGTNATTVPARPRPRHLVDADDDRSPAPQHRRSDAGQVLVRGAGVAPTSAAGTGEQTPMPPSPEHTIPRRQRARRSHPFRSWSGAVTFAVAMGKAPRRVRSRFDDRWSRGFGSPRSSPGRLRATS